MVFLVKPDKLVQMGLAIVTALGAVMASRNSKLFSSGDVDGFKRISLTSVNLPCS